MASFEEIVTLEDALVQSRIGPLADLILAAALVRAAAPQRDKIRANLSPRRAAAVDECADEAQRLPSRARFVARRVMAKVLFGIEDEETKQGLAALSSAGAAKEEEPTRRELLRRVLERNPEAKKAKEARRLAATVEHLRRMMRGGAN